MTHYGDIDLIDLYYLGDEAAEMRQHVDACAECAGKYRALSASLAASAAQQRPDMPESFWARQKHAILRRVAAERRPWWQKPVMRFSVAAGFALVIAGGWLMVARQQTAPLQPHSVVTQTASAAVDPQPADSAILGEFDAGTDPWASDELEPLRGVVAWESWVVQNGDTGGTL